MLSLPLLQQFDSSILKTLMAFLRRPVSSNLGYLGHLSSKESNLYSFLDSFKVYLPLGRYALMSPDDYRNSHDS